jgi:hypothetical protein
MNPTQIFKDICGSDEFYAANIRRKELDVINQAADVSEDGSLRFQIGNSRHEFYRIVGLTAEGIVKLESTYATGRTHYVYLIKCGREKVFGFVSKLNTTELARHHVYSMLRNPSGEHLKAAIRGRNVVISQEFSGVKILCDQYLDSLRQSKKLTLDYKSGKKYETNRDSRLKSKDGFSYVGNAKMFRDWCESIGFDGNQGLSVYDALHGTYKDDEIKDMVSKYVKGLPVE